MSWIQIKLCAFDLRKKVKKNKHKKSPKPKNPNQAGLRIKLKNECLDKCGCGYNTDSLHPEAGMDQL